MPTAYALTENFLSAQAVKKEKARGIHQHYFGMRKSWLE